MTVKKNGMHKGVKFEISTLELKIVDDPTPVS
jgi:hypothetical protein